MTEHKPPRKKSFSEKYTTQSDKDKDENIGKKALNDDIYALCDILNELTEAITQASHVRK